VPFEKFVDSPYYSESELCGGAVTVFFRSTSLGISSPNIVRVIKSRRMRWAGHVERMGEGRGVYRVLVGRPEGKRPLGRCRCRWEDNIKMDLREIGIDGANWIQQKAGYFVTS
jgi:hypothetical protein